MADSEITLNRCNPICLCNRSLDGDTLPLQNGGRSSDVVQCLLALVLRRSASFCFGVRIRLGTILGRFSIIYFRGLGLRIRVRVWVMVRARVRVWVMVGVSVVLGL